MARQHFPEPELALLRMSSGGTIFNAEARRSAEPRRDELRIENVPVSETSIVSLRFFAVLCASALKNRARNFARSLTAITLGFFALAVCAQEGEQPSPTPAKKTGGVKLQFLPPPME